MISLIRLLLLLLRLLLLPCECARDLNFTVPFVWARMNELIRNRTPPIRIRVERVRKLKRIQSAKEMSFCSILCLCLLFSFLFDRSIGKKSSLEKQARIRTTNNTEEGV
jgi:hypothetical protein